MAMVSFSLSSKATSLWKVCRMAPSIPSLRRLNCASSPRFFCSGYPVLESLSRVLPFNHLCRCLVYLKTNYSGCNDCKTQSFSRDGTGVLLAPRIVVTSAYMVGDASISYKDECSAALAVSVGSTVAVNFNIPDKTLVTKPLALNFENDLAVLELMEPEGVMLSHCALASSPAEKENILVNLGTDADERLIDYTMTLGTVRSVGTARVEAPWPRNDALSGWLELDCSFNGGSGVPLYRTSSTSPENVSGWKITGSPWFNLDGEVVGIASWEAFDEAAKVRVGYAASSPAIASVLHYAKTKHPSDLIVMDRFIVPPKISGN